MSMSTINQERRIQSDLVCCCGADGWTTVIAWFQIVMSLIGTVALVGILIAAGVAGPQKVEEVTHDQYMTPEFRFLSFRVVMAILGVILATVVLALAMGIVLLKGVHERNPTYLTVWIIYSILQVVFHVIVKGVTINSVTLSGGIIGIVLTVAINAFFIWVVFKFKSEVVQSNNLWEKEHGGFYKA